MYAYINFHQPGYCAKQQKVLSDDEYFEIVLGGLMKSDSIKLKPTDTDVHAYLVNHPNCCKVIRGENGSAFYRGVFSRGTIEVDVIYELSENGIKRYGAGTDTHYEYLEDMSDCGEYLDSAGTSTERAVQYNYSPKTNPWGQVLH
jgi:hypothetical protein